MAGRKRKLCKRQPNGQPSRRLEPDHGSPWLRQHADIRERETRTAGMRCAYNARECLLDALLRDGALGDSPKSDDRHSAGIWLRGLHERAFSQSVTGAYAEPIVGAGNGNLQAIFTFGKIINGLGYQWPTVRKLCIEEITPVSVEDAQEVLDVLVKFRLDNTRKM